MKVFNISAYVPEWLANSSVYGVVITDLEGRYLYANEILERKFAESNKIVGKLATQTIHTEDIEKCRKAVKTCIHNPNQPVSVFLRKSYQNQDDFFLTQWEFSALRDENDHVIGILCVGFDVSAINKFQKELEIQESKLRAILENSKSSIVLIDKNYNILLSNKFAQEIAHKFFNRNLVEGESFLPFITEISKNDFFNSFAKAMQGETTKMERKRIFDEKELWFEVEYVPIYKNNGELLGVSLVTTNIDEKKKAELTLKKQNELLKEIAYLQSHAIRRPVASILGLISILDQNNLSEENKLIFKHLLTASQELDKIIHQVVDKTQEI